MRIIQAFSSHFICDRMPVWAYEHNHYPASGNSLVYGIIKILS
jgi:hypothetical protein